MTMEPMDALQAAVQAVVDANADGWSVGHYVVVAGLERLDTEANRVVSAVWTITPVDQAEWMTKGLLDAAMEIQLTADADVEDD